MKANEIWEYLIQKMAGFKEKSLRSWLPAATAYNYGLNGIKWVADTVKKRMNLYLEDQRFMDLFNHRLFQVILLFTV